MDSPIQKIEGKYRFYLKRDDLLDPRFSGNKARKLHFFLKSDLAVDTLVSYGSLHSNAMYSLSELAKLKKWRFIYYAAIDEKALQNPKGNLAAALENGMELRSIEELAIDDPNSLSHVVQKGSTLLVPEGVRCKEAQTGVALLAKEIEEWEGEARVFLPSGTGATALFLQKHLGLRVYTTPCVGDERYLKEQFFALEPDSKYHPTILPPPKRYRFGRLYKELFSLWKDLYEHTGVEFDLLYDPVGFATLLHHDMVDERLLYIHQGGLKGNETMIERYKAKFATIT